LKTIAYLLITISFLVASYYSVIDTEQVPWPKVVPALLVGLAGVALVHLSNRGRRRSVDMVRSNIGKLEQSLASIVAKAEALDADKENLDPYEVRYMIDDQFMTDLDTFVQNRETIGDAFGLQVYANIMTHFATGERHLNRCWSASTDGYVDEINKYLTRAKNEFEQALTLLRSHSETT
jgi:hypothetical protein